MPEAVIARAHEINSRVKMIAVIEEEWAGLEFEPNARWCGINHLVAKVEPTLEAVIEEDGWDTIYMHK